MSHGALANLDDNAAIAELASGILSKQIAERYGVTPFAVRKRLAKHPDYQQAIKDQAESFVEEAVDEVRSVPLDNIAIARARAKADVALKWAAARDPGTWGAKPELGGLTVNVQIVAFSEGNRLDVMPVLSNSPASLPAPQQSTRAQHLAALASLSPDELRALQAEVENRIAEGRNRSPVAPGLVDSGGDQFASVVSGKGS